MEREWSAFLVFIVIENPIMLLCSLAILCGHRQLIKTNAQT